MAEVNPGITEITDLASKLQGGAAGTSSPAMDIGSLLGHMSMTAIIISLLAGLVGSAYFMYGKKTCNFRMVFSGLALCVVPYFITNTFLLIPACLAMAAAPFLL